MPVQFGINGFGRIGRLVMRAALDNPGTNKRMNERVCLELCFLDTRGKDSFGSDLFDANQSKQ